MPAIPALILYGAVTAAFGSLGGLGGATVLVPLLLVTGVDVEAAAPLGLISVASASLAAGARQLDGGLVHHRLGLTVESVASTAAVIGALASTSVPEAWLARSLGLGALCGAVATLARKGTRNQADVTFLHDSPGEWPGTLGGTYHHGESAIPYQATRVPQGLAVASIAGLIAGMAGVGGGFLKTPAMSEVMRVPVKVAAATTTFTTGITAAAGLIVFSGQGRLDVPSAAGVALGSTMGAFLGTIVQERLHARNVRTVTGVLLLVIGVTVLVRSFT